jgi:ParB/RepB/Spo0J family partition protein
MNEQMSLAPEEALIFDDEMVKLSAIEEFEDGFGHAPESLVRSIHNYGLMQPVVLEALPDDAFRIIAGRRRLAACLKLKHEYVPARIPHLSDGWTSTEVLTLIENAERGENAPAKLRAIAHLLELGYEAKGIGKATGYKLQEIEELLPLLDLRPSLLKLFYDGKLTKQAAKTTAKLSEDQQRTLAALAIMNNKLTAADIKIVRSAQREDAQASLPDALFDTPELAVRTWQQEVRALLGRAQQLVLDHAGAEGEQLAGAIQVDIETLDALE